MTFYLCGETAPTTLALPTISTISNSSIASFSTDLTENLVSCVCEVASGSSEINVSATGLNIWQYGDLSVTTNQNLNVNIPVGTYNLSGEWVTNSGYNCLVIFYDENNTEIVRSTFTPDIRDNKSYQFNTPCKRIVFYSGDNYSHSNGKTATISNIMLKQDSSVADYEPFGTTYNIQFGETLSDDGTFDVLTGILTRSDDTTKQLSANYIQTNNGTNNIYADTGDISECKYIQTLRNRYL